MYMNKQYYICYGSMFLDNFSVNEFAYKNDFIDTVKFSYSCNYCDTYSFDYANKIIEVLVKIGFNKDKLFLREDNKNDENKEDFENEKD